MCPPAVQHLRNDCLLHHFPAVRKSGGRLLTNIDVFDVYVGENVEPGKKSIAYSLKFEDPSRTLTEDEVMQVFNKIINDVTTKLDAKLRDK